MDSTKKVVLHACCAVCLGHPHKLLTDLGYDVQVLFYNPNIYPLEEYKRRRDELVRYCKSTNTPYEIIENSQNVFYSYVEGLEQEPERGLRCERCFELRLEKTAQYAKSIEADYFSSTLSVSPHKSFSQIKLVAQTAARKFGVDYLEMDFKKQNGFLKTNEIAKQYDFYRQSYCGCEFSLEKSKEKIRY